MADFKKNKTLILQRVEHEIATGFEYIDEKIGERFKGIFGRLLRRVARELFQWAEKKGVTRRGVRIFDYVLDVAHKNPDADIKEVAAEHLDGYLKLHELYVRTKPDHPASKKLKNALKKEFEARLRIYRPILEAKGKTYEELVRAAYPDKKVLLKLVDEQVKTTGEVIRIIQENPDMIRIPATLRKPIFNLMTASIEFMHEKIVQDIERMYEK